MTAVPMQTIDRARLNTDLAYRVAFSRDFIEFTSDDQEILHKAAPLILPVITEASLIVDGVYEHLFEFSYTKEVFLKRQAEEGGEHEKDITKLSLDSPQMVLRRKMLTFWLAKILTADFEDMKVWEFMDRVGVMHTGQPAFKHRLNKQPLHVDLHALTLTLGWVTDVVITIVMEFPKNVLSTAKKAAVLKAFNKLIWLQQDLFQRHYVRSDEEATANLAKVQDGAREALVAEKMAEVKLRAVREVKEEVEAREAAEGLPEVEVE